MLSDRSSLRADVSMAVGLMMDKAWQCSFSPSLAKQLSLRSLLQQLLNGILSLYVHCWLVLGFNWCSSLFQILLDSRDGVIFVEQVFRGIDFCLCV
jgi:hypothetical protein